MGVTDRLDLRSGRPAWPVPRILPSDALPERCDVAVLGAGVMGAMVAERLSREGRDVVVLDRRPPAHGSTAASTALVQWAADTPLLHLSRRWGEQKAERTWRRLHRTVLDLDAHIRDAGFDCGWAGRSEIYLPGTLLDEEALKSEARRRVAAGLPSRYMTAEDVEARFHLPPRACIASADAFGLDPVAFTLQLLERAREAGAALVHPVDVVHLEEGDRSILLRCADGSGMMASQLILASGYEIARQFLPPVFTRSTTFAIASAAGMARAWEGDAMIWEASDSYLYSRRTPDGRILVGGGDVAGIGIGRREALMASKRTWLEGEGARLLGLDELHADRAWAAVFGNSPDGLPAIGRAAGAERIWLAYGFGGNGVTFAALAAALLSGALVGMPDGDLELFDPYRFEL